MAYVAMSAEEFDDEDAIEDDIKDPAFVLRNLGIAGMDCFDDDTNMNQARIAIATIITQQICFYVSCVLHGFKNKQIAAAPNILIYGGGFVGKRVIEGLVDNKCGPMLYVYSRGDLRAKYWRSTGLKASPSLTRLMKDVKADVVILLSGMSSFTNLTKQLMPFMTRSTCILSSSLGLERKRFFALFRTPAIFRTYVEAPSLVEMLSKNPKLAGELGAGRLDIDHGVIPPNRYEAIVQSPVGASGETKGETNGDTGGSTVDNAGMTHMDEPATGTDRASPRSPGLDSDFGGGGVDVCSPMANEDLEEESLHGTILDSIFSFRLDPRPLLKDTVEGSVEHAADLVAQRLRCLEDFVYVLENYYATIGIPHRKARAAALYATLGYTTDGYAEVCSGVSTDGLGNENNSAASSRESGQVGGGDDLLKNVLKSVKVVSYPLLIEGIDALSGAIAIHFRRQFSKYIKVVDIPRCEELDAEPKPKGAEDRKKAKLARMKSKSEQSGLLSLMQASMADGNLKVGDGDARDDGANDEDSQEKSHALGHGVPIHSDKVLQKIFAYDVKLTGRSAMVADRLEDWTADLDGNDDESSIATATMNRSLDGADGADDGDGSCQYNSKVSDVKDPGPKLSVADFATALPPPMMMANPLVAKKLEEESEMKLLLFLEEEARRKSDAAKSKKK